MGFFNSVIKIVFGIIVAGVVVFILAFKTFIAPPSDFPVPYQVTVRSGETTAAIASELHTAHVIKNEKAFRAFMVLFGKDTGVAVGDYYFDKPVTSLEVALRISGTDFGIGKVKVTFPEGYTVSDIAKRLKETYPNFDTDSFLALSKGKEGYLFPDTYHFFPTVAPQTVVDTLSNNFTAKLSPLLPDIASTKHSLEQTIIMASIIEREANGKDDAPVIAGILWKRLDAGIALQVDATGLYLPSNTAYDTYAHKGLPPAPIANPGLTSITAAIHPVSSPYLYYLHDASGAVHYAKTYEEHKQNIKKYL